MKKFSSFFSIFIAVFILAAIFATFAMAGTRLIKDGSKMQTPIQNLKGAAAVPAAARCDTVGSTTAVQKQYSTAGYIGIKATSANKNTGAPLVVNWQENGKTVWVGSDYEAVNEGGTAISSVKAAAFTNRTALFCIRRH